MPVALCAWQLLISAHTNTHACTRWSNLRGEFGDVRWVCRQLSNVNSSCSRHIYTRQTNKQTTVIHYSVKHIIVEFAIYFRNKTFLQLVSAPLSAQMNMVIFWTLSVQMQSFRQHTSLFTDHLTVINLCQQTRQCNDRLDEIPIFQVRHTDNMFD